MNASTFRAAAWLAPVIVLGVGWNVVALGQAPGDVQPPSTPSATTTPVENGSQPPELPPVIVRPPEETTAPGDSATGDMASPFDQPYEYPSLFPGPSERFLDSLTGDAAGARSIFDDPRHVTVIDRTDLQKRQPVDMAQALEREVGVLIQRTGQGQASPFIRGLTGQQVLILVDGIRMNNSTYRIGPNQYFNTIDPGQVDHIEVTRGPQSALYGADALGGVINVVTRSAEGLGQYNYAGGSAYERFSTADAGSYTRMNLEGSVDRSGLFAGGSWLALHDVDRGGDLGRQGGTGYQQYAGDLKYTYLLDDDSLLTASLQHFEQDHLFRSDRFPSRQTIFDPQQRDLGYLRWQGTWDCGPVNAYQLTASYGRQKEGSRDTRDSTSNLDIAEFDVDTVGLSMIFSTDLCWAGTLTYGADWYHDDVDASANRYNKNTGAFTGARTPRFPDDSFYERTGVFAQWDVPLTERLSAVSGIRYTNIDLGSTPIIAVSDGMGGTINTPLHIAPSFQDWSSGGGLTYALTEELNLVGTISEGFRAPSLDDLVATNTNVQQSAIDTPSINLVPESSLNYEVGLKLDARRLRGQAFVFWTELDDQILRTPGGTVGNTVLFSSTNRDSRLNGVELAGDYLLDCGWSVYGNFAYILGEDLVFDEPLSRVPPTQGVLGLAWRDTCHRNWFQFYTWMVRHQDRLNFQDFSDRRIPAGGTPGFATLNVKAGTQLAGNQRITVGLENLLDKAYRVHGSGVDGPGISGIFGYELFW